MSVMQREFDFLESLGDERLLLGKCWGGFRYVDNLATISSCQLPSALYDQYFYEEPVVLEDEPDLSFLGLQIHTCRLGVEAGLIVPGFDKLSACLLGGTGTGDLVQPLQNDMWRYRSPASAGSIGVLVSGFSARLHLAARLSFPVRRAQASVIMLFVICVVLRIPVKALMDLLKVHSMRYPSVYSPVVGRALAATFLSNSYYNLRSLVRLVEALQDES